MKQSSIEFAVTSLEKLIPSGNQLAIGAILEQAREMLKEEIMDAVEYGCSDWGCAKDAEHYYNETFNTEEK